MKYICTYCSRKKSKHSGLIPAKERYSSDRVKEVIKIAKEKNINLLFLSGKFGLVPAEEMIPYYDLRLTSSLVPSMIETSLNQAKSLKVTELVFYTKSQNEELKPYHDVIKQVCKRLKIKLSLATLLS